MNVNARQCEACGYVVGVERLAVLVEGRMSTELTLCARHRSEALSTLRLLKRKPAA